MFLLKQISSTGYLRKRLPQELVVLNGGAGGMALTGTDDTEMVLQALVPEVSSSSSHSMSGSMAPTVSTAGNVSITPRAKAKMQGYEGDPCGDCGNYTLVRNGTCMKCNTCGSTSGCS